MAEAAIRTLEEAQGVLYKHTNNLAGKVEQLTEEHRDFSTKPRLTPSEDSGLETEERRELKRSTAQMFEGMETAISICSVASLSTASPILKTPALARLPSTRQCVS